MPKGNAVYPPDTYQLSPLAFGATAGVFDSPSQGEELAGKWGYTDGYQAAFQPAGLIADVVKGEYYTTVDTFLFKDENGAHEAYSQFETKYGTLTGSERIQGVKGLANESSAWKYDGDLIANTQIGSVFHRFIFRRGSMLSVVQTYGAAPFMTIDKARDIAITLDDKALGSRPAPTPTPGSGGTPIVPAQ
jgi:hypothetical protein